jgi:hypothetical protein
MFASWHKFPIARAVVLSLALAGSIMTASAEDPAVPPAQATPAETAPATPQAERLPTPKETFSALGRLIDQSISTLGESIKSTGETLGNVTGAVGDTAGAMVRVPTNIVSGRERCPLAANGAPDCTAASTALCKQKGYTSGTSADITSAQACPATVLLQGRSSGPECRNESFVSKAVCQ